MLGPLEEQAQGKFDTLVVFHVLGGCGAVGEELAEVLEPLDGKLYVVEEFHATAYAETILELVGDLGDVAPTAVVIPLLLAGYLITEEGFEQTERTHDGKVDTKLKAERKLYIACPVLPVRALGAVDIIETGTLYLICQTGLKAENRSDFHLVCDTGVVKADGLGSRFLKVGLGGSETAENTNLSVCSNGGSKCYRNDCDKFFHIDYRLELILSMRAFLGIAPTVLSTACPPLKKIRVGMLMIR